MDFETTPTHCPICDADVEVPADLFAVMRQMPKVIPRAVRARVTNARSGNWNRLNSPQLISVGLAPAFPG